MAAFPILYEDNHVIVIEKPFNMPTQEDATRDLDVVNALKQDLKQRYDKPGNVFVGLVHRLDRPVGGAMLFAKTSKAASRLSDQVRTHRFQKAYLAIVHGTPQSLHGELVDYLVKDPKTNIVTRTHPRDPNGKKAVLTYQCGTTQKGYTLVAIRLHTGRPHQIRVQLSGLGHPLFGDQKYGQQLNRAGQQIALWSTRIGFQHPTQKEPVWCTQLPPRSEQWGHWHEDEMRELVHHVLPEMNT
ncbi:RluA family pseudouridine synthase [Marinicrinis sediminis]|uniref:RNA pseudouridylate synthase n=1 Tax=Marinicrinis sediminis TaxID=1652465 RepID=A0ABW5RG29_9BACL